MDMGFGFMLVCSHLFGKNIGFLVGSFDFDICIVLGVMVNGVK